MQQHLLLELSSLSNQHKCLFFFCVYFSEWISQTHKIQRAGSCVLFKKLPEWLSFWSCVHWTDKWEHCQCEKKNVQSIVFCFKWKRKNRITFFEHEKSGIGVLKATGTKNRSFHGHKRREGWELLWLCQKEDVEEVMNVGWMWVSWCCLKHFVIVCANHIYPVPRRSETAQCFKAFIFCELCHPSFSFFINILSPSDHFKLQSFIMMIGNEMKIYSQVFFFKKRKQIYAACAFLKTSHAKVATAPTPSDSQCHSTFISDFVSCLFIVSHLLHPVWGYLLYSPRKFNFISVWLTLNISLMVFAPSTPISFPVDSPS